jgi:protease-4
MLFARKVWHLLVAIKDGLVLFFMLLFFVMLYGALTTRPSAGQVRDGALLVKLNGSLVEEPAARDPLDLLMGGAPIREYRARDVVRAIRLAARDERIKAVVLDLSSFTGGGLVHMEEVGAAMDEVRAAKKPVLTYAVAYIDDGVMLAAHASEAWLHPLGGAAISGPGGSQAYFAGLLQRFKVNVHVYKVGTYKDFVEPFLLDRASAPSKEARGALLASMFDTWLANVTKARPNAQYAQAARDPVGWASAAGGDLAQAALKAGMVDKLGDAVEFGERVKELAGADGSNRQPGSYAHSGMSALLAAHPPETTGKAIAVVTVAGNIVDGKAGPGTAGGDRITSLIDEANADDAAALVLRIDSPGGSALASEQVRKAVERFKAKGRPVAVSMANVAASGGYWIAASGNRIFAQPGSVTGSIGIFAVLPSFEGTLAQYGVTSDGVRTTPLSGQPDIMGGFTPESDKLLQGSIEAGYRRFIGLVGTARGKTPAEVDAVAQGRAWDGGTARQNGLVDQFGGLEDALAWAAGQAKLESWHAQYYGREADPYASLLERLGGGDEEDAGQARDLFALMALRQQSHQRDALARLTWLGEVKGAQALCLDCPVPATRIQPQGRANWLAQLAQVLGIG